MYVTTYVRLSLIPLVVILAVSYELYHRQCCAYRSQQPTKPVTAGRKLWRVVDWVGLPVALFIYFVVPEINAMFWQLVTEKLDYTVATKPTAGGQGVAVSGSDPDTDCGDEHERMDRMESSSVGERGVMVLSPVVVCVERSSSPGKGHVPRDSGVVMDLCA
jgi:hypothetical protein